MDTKLDIRKLTQDLYTPSTMRDLQCLHRFARVAGQNKECRIAELGTLNGVSAMVMASAIQVPGIIYTVDTYMGHKVRIGKKNTRVVLSHANVLKEIKKRGLDDRLIAIKSNDIAWLKECDDDSLDMLELDSQHTYEHVLKTLEIGLPKMRDNAIVCGHDYTPRGKGVIYAVEDWRRKYQDQVCGFSVEGLTWWTMIRKR